MKDSREYFDSVAPEWDRIREGYFSSAVRDKAIELAGINSETIAADIGTGTGFMLEGIAPLVKKVIGVDNSPRMLYIAQSKLPEKLRPKVEFRLGEMDHLPLKEGEVNAVFANMA
ncbi:MAG: class I SAM-dependent methyltransferase, partial [Acidobacteriota bacterium]